MVEKAKSMQRLRVELTRMRDRVSELERMIEGLKGTERVLIKSEEETWQLFEEAPNAYQSLDSNGHILRVNHAWMDILGHTRRDVIGKWFGSFLKPEDQEHFKKRFECFKREGVARGVEFDIKRKAGSLLSVSIDGRIATGERGRFRHSHCIRHDVSARKRAEDPLRLSTGSSVVSSGSVLPLTIS